MKDCVFDCICARERETESGRMRERGRTSEWVNERE